MQIIYSKFYKTILKGVFPTKSSQSYEGWKAFEIRPSLNCNEVKEWEKADFVGIIKQFDIIFEEKWNDL